jgi:hypothetical protein
VFGHEVHERENSFDCDQMALNVCHLLKSQQSDLNRLSACPSSTRSQKTLAEGDSRAAKWRHAVERLIKP